MIMMMLVTVVYLTVLVLYVPLYGSIFQSLKRQRKCHPTATSGVWSVHNTLWGATVFPPLLVVAALLPLPLLLERTLFCIDMACVCCAVRCCVLLSSPPLLLGPPTPVHWPSPAVFTTSVWRGQIAKAASRRFRNFRISPFSRELEGFCAVQGVHRELRAHYTNGIVLYCIVLYCSSLVS